MKFFRKLKRATLLDLHRSGVLQVFRRHSIFRAWVPLRENFDHREDTLRYPPA